MHCQHKEGKEECRPAAQEGMKDKEPGSSQSHTGKKKTSDKRYKLKYRKFHLKVFFKKGFNCKGK